VTEGLRDLQYHGAASNKMVAEMAPRAPAPNVVPKAVHAAVSVTFDSAVGHKRKVSRKAWPQAVRALLPDNSGVTFLRPCGNCSPSAQQVTQGSGCFFLTRYVHLCLGSLAQASDHVHQSHNEREENRGIGQASGHPQADKAGLGEGIGRNADVEVEEGGDGAADGGDSDDEAAPHTSTRRRLDLSEAALLASSRRNVGGARPDGGKGMGAAGTSGVARDMGREEANGHSNDGEGPAPSLLISETAGVQPQPLPLPLRQASAERLHDRDYEVPVQVAGPGLHARASPLLPPPQQLQPALAAAAAAGREGQGPALAGHPCKAASAVLQGPKVGLVVGDSLPPAARDLRGGAGGSGSGGAVVGLGGGGGGRGDHVVAAAGTAAGVTLAQYRDIVRQNKVASRLSVARSPVAWCSVAHYRS
jgi:hypothetical protein